MFFDKFERQVQVTGTLRCATALRIGSGKSLDSVAADLPVLKDSLGRPFIPGASVKGVVRSSVEAVLRGMAATPDETVAWTCDPLSAPCTRGESEAGLSLKESRKRAVAVREDLERGLCLVCRTFGAPGLASHVVFRDLVPLGDARVERRDGVAIDRDLGRVSGARKYDFEVVAPGSAFQFVLELDSPEPWQEGLVAIGLDLLDQGVARLGGAKSRGLGVVKFEELAVRTLTKELLVAGEAPMVSGYGDWRKSVLVSWTDKVGQMKGRR